MIFFRKKITLFLLLLLTLFFVGCDMDSDKFAQYNSGDKIILTLANYDDFVDVESKKLSAKTDADLFVGIVFKYSTYGYDAFSYFNVELTVKVQAKALNDSGEYETVEFTQVLFLNEAGKCTKHDTYKFGNAFRNLKDITWSVSKVSGFVVKK